MKNMGSLLMFLFSSVLLFGQNNTIPTHRDLLYLYYKGAKIELTDKIVTNYIKDYFESDYRNFNQNEFEWPTVLNKYRTELASRIKDATLTTVYTFQSEASLGNYNFELGGFDVNIKLEYLFVTKRGLSVGNGTINPDVASKAILIFMNGIKRFDFYKMDKNEANTFINSRTRNGNVNRNVTLVIHFSIDNFSPDTGGFLIAQTNNSISAKLQKIDVYDGNKKIGEITSKTTVQTEKAMAVQADAPLGTYNYDSSNNITFNDNNYVLRTENNIFRGTFTLTGSTFILNDSGSTADWINGRWRIENSNTIFDPDGDTWTKQSGSAGNVSQQQQTTTPTPAVSAESYFKNGYAALQSNDYDKAIADFTQVILLDPKADAAYFLRALAYDEKGDYDNSIVDYIRNIQLDPNNEFAYIRRGNIYFIKQDYDKAIADYNQAIRLVPNNKGYKKGLEIIQRRGKSSVEFPAGFVGTWKRDKFNNTLTFDKNSFKPSNQNSTRILSDSSGNSYTFYSNGYPASNSTITIRLVKSDLVISGDSGDGEDNWNGTWKKQ